MSSLTKEMHKNNKSDSKELIEVKSNKKKASSILPQIKDFKELSNPNNKNDLGTKSISLKKNKDNKEEKIKNKVKEKINLLREPILYGKEKNNDNDNNNDLNYKQFKVYINNSFVYEPNSSNRVLTIPSKGVQYGYAVGANGEVELLADPEIDKKYNGTKNNSVGPGSYETGVNSKKRGAIDWSRSSAKLNGEKSSSKTDNIKNIFDIESLYLNSNRSCNKLSNKIQDEINIKNKNDFKINMFNDKIYKNNIIRMKSTENPEYIDLTSIPSKPEKKITPGPGAYNFNDEFAVIPKNCKYQNFGSSVNRGLELPKDNKDIKNRTNSNPNLHKEIKFSFFADNLSQNNRKTIIPEKYNLNKEKRILHDIKVDLLKSYSLKSKKKDLTKLGPGSYNIDTKPNSHRPKKIENFGILEERFNYQNKDNTPGAGSYISLDNWDKKNSWFKTIDVNDNRLQTEVNIYEKKYRDSNSKTIDINDSPGVGKYSPEYRQSIEYNNQLCKMVSQKRPGFGTGEPRFYIFKSQINRKNGVGKYNLLYPLRNIKQQKIPFNNSLVRSGINNQSNIGDSNPFIGPGSYKHDSFFDWNKKSFNVVYKNSLINTNN